MVNTKAVAIALLVAAILLSGCTITSSDRTVPVEQTPVQKEVSGAWGTAEVVVVPYCEDRVICYVTIGTYKSGISCIGEAQQPGILTRYCRKDVSFLEP